MSVRLTISTLPTANRLSSMSVLLRVRPGCCSPVGLQAGVASTPAQQRPFDGRNLLPAPSRAADQGSTLVRRALCAPEADSPLQIDEGRRGLQRLARIDDDLKHQHAP